MSPKLPRKPTVITSHQPESPASPTHRLDGTPPELSRPGFNDGTTPGQAVGQQITTEQSPAPAVEVLPVASRSAVGPQPSAVANDYWLSEAFLRGMKPADADGFRWIVGRRFVDVEFEGAVKTTQVGQDESGAWRSKRLTEHVPSGPRLYKNAGSPTWRLTEQPAPKRPAETASEQPGGAPTAKRPRPSPVATPIDQSRYSSSWRSPDTQGYYEMKPFLGSNDADTQFAFRDAFGNLMRVDPPVGGFDAQPTHLTQWTDHEIWQLYGLQGQDITRFRVEAQTIGKPPQWAEPTSTGNPVKDLLGDSLRWLHPTMTLKERETFLQSCNLLPDQLTRLQRDMQNDLAIPAWVQAHKRLVEDVDNPQRLEQFASDAAEQLNLRRGARHRWYDPEANLTEEVREALLKKLGYRRNKNNCLYRDDIPALFRGDDRTPFELASDGVMLPRYHHVLGSTTHKPMSATFSLDEGRMYASKPDPEYLRFNSQTNKHPGRELDGSGSDSDASDSSGRSSSSWSDPASPVAWDHESGYRSTRTRQTEMFLYALDTRNLEVVPREENFMFNYAAQHTPPTRFPDDNFEGLVSVTRSGLPADRIWLLNTDLTKGARVSDINEMTGADAERIEAATHAGQANKFEYDQLIDKVEAAARPILRLSGNKNEFAHDIVWP